MERLVFTLALLSSCSPVKAKTLHLGDVVKFEFTERNLFYADVCNNFGEVINKIERSSGNQYLLNVWCKSSRTFPKGIWIDAEDVMEVTRLSKDAYK